MYIIYIFRCIKMCIYTKIILYVQNTIYNFHYYYIDYILGVIRLQEQEFENTVRLYYHSIYNYCLSKVKDINSAQDCTQEVFLIMYQKINVLDSCNIRAWLYRTADNIIKNYRKVSARQNETVIEEAEKIIHTDYYDEEKVLSGVLKEQELKMLCEHYLYGYDIADVAKKNGKSTASVYKMFQRLKVKLRKYIGSGGD